MMLSRCLSLLIGGLVLLLPAVCLRAGSLVEYEGVIGYLKLKQELQAQGIPLPDGAGVKVSQIEAFANDPSDPTKFMPSTGSVHFSGKTFTQLSTGSSTFSSHAQDVAKNFYSRAVAISTGITEINLYSASGWLNNDYLKYTSSSLPLSVPARVANHSWVGEIESGGAPDPTSDRNILRRLDYIIATDEYIQVVGLNNGSNRYNLLGSSMNAISVGRADGNHALGTDLVQGNVYIAGLSRPDLVVPENATSFAAPVVSSAAALLIQVARDNPQLSKSLVTTPSTRNNLTLRNAESSEVIRALLMAGADRYAITDYPNGYTYTANTSNNLDQRFGAGMLNVYNSYKILTAGEFDSVQDGGGAFVGPRGFDYDPQFGIGGGGVNSTASYTFIPTGNEIDFNASLVWNLRTTLSGTSGTETLNNLDLRLWDITAPASPVLVQASLSTNQNTEHIRELLYPLHTYKLEVTRTGPTPFVWDYALAWRTDTFFQDGDFDQDGDVDIWDFMVIQGNFGATSATPLMGDLDLDQDVDKRDYDLFRANWGWRSDTHGISIPLSLGAFDFPGPDPGAQPPTDPSSVPEPISALLLLGLAALPIRRRRAAA